jgi:hypothetical protein
MILRLRTGALIGCQRQRLHVIFLAATAAKLARRHSLKPLTTQPHLSEFFDQNWPSWFPGDRHPKVPQGPRMRTARSRPPFTGLPCERYRTISRSRDIETPCICQTKVSLVTPLVGQNPSNRAQLSLDRVPPRPHGASPPSVSPVSVAAAAPCETAREQARGSSSTPTSPARSRRSTIGQYF